MMGGEDFENTMVREYLIGDIDAYIAARKGA